MIYQKLDRINLFILLFYFFTYCQYFIRDHKIVEIIEKYNSIESIEYGGRFHYAPSCDVLAFLIEFGEIIIVDKIGEIIGNKYKF